MENTKIGNVEAIAIILTIVINHAILNITKSIISNTNSASILNIIYVSIIAIFISFIIYLLLKRFPTSDILDISNILGGKPLKTIIGILFFAYFIFFSSMLLKNFALCLQIICYPSTNLFYIILLFILGTIFCCSLKYNSIYRSNLLILPFLLLGIIFIFIGNIKNFSTENIFPILGNGINSTFISGLSNLIVFQGIAYLYFLPSLLKKPSSLKKICITSIIISAIYVLLCVSTVSLLFSAFVDTDELLPIFSAVRYIEYGNFFQRIDSLFILILVISFISYLSIVVATCSNILKKITPVKSSKYFIYISALLMLIISMLPKNYAISTYISNVVYKYSFFVLVIGISMFILILANFKKKKV
ncbi:MAG: GerAB/ArcD/ProY family transporter [Clostridia bacterium]|nr:GerAB/ArcD/ProY family transporter [Clostridia bacterium]